jgi:transposase
MEEAGKLKIYYGDESGFSLEPCISYGWQPPGEYVRITPVGGKRWLVSSVEPLNIFGLLSRDNDLHAFSTQGTVDTDMVIACMDEFAKTITMKTVVVLDNASIHRSEKFNGSTMLTNHAKLLEWSKKGLRIFHLPPYSPHLNIIECFDHAQQPTLWRKVKYEWLKPSDYASWEALQKTLENILTLVGKGFNIDFEELKHFKEYKLNKAAIIYD